MTRAARTTFDVHFDQDGSTETMATGRHRYRRAVQSSSAAATLGPTGEGCHGSGAIFWHPRPLVTSLPLLRDCPYKVERLAGKWPHSPWLPTYNANVGEDRPRRGRSLAPLAEQAAPICDAPSCGEQEDPAASKLLKGSGKRKAFWELTGQQPFEHAGTAQPSGEQADDGAGLSGDSASPCSYMGLRWDHFPACHFAPYKSCFHQWH